MMTNLERIDTVPLLGNDFTFEFQQWLTTLVDSINTSIGQIESFINLASASPYSATQITTMNMNGQLFNGILLYDTTNNEYVGMQAGSLVKFTTTSYP
jgi:hypothetical protein